MGFLVTMQPGRLEADIRRLKREVRPRGRAGEFHSREDESNTRAALRSLLVLNDEPLFYVVEWMKDRFLDRCSGGHLRVFSDSNPMLASFAMTAANFAAAAATNGIDVLDVVVERVKIDIRSEHRSREQALSRILMTVLSRQSALRRPAPGTTLAVKVSTVEKQANPALSFADYWLWAYSRRVDRGDAESLPDSLLARTTVRVMTLDEVSLRSDDQYNVP